MSMREEVVLHKKFGIWCRGGLLLACGSEVPKYFVGVPFDAQKLYAVFTDARPTNSNYTISKPRLLHGSRMSRLADIRQPLYFRGERLLAEMYEKGYRYLSIEYDA